MSDNKPTEEVDVTKEWRATHGQKSAAKRLRIFAALVVDHRHRRPRSPGSSCSASTSSTTATFRC